MPYRLCSCGHLLPLGVKHDHRTTHGEPRSGRPHRRRVANVLRRDGYVCHYCGGEATTGDHVIPIVKGGVDEESNMVASCQPCNLSKGAKTLDG